MLLLINKFLICNLWNDINNKVFSFKVDNNIVYAGGLLKVHILEVVKFEIEKKIWRIY